MSIVRYEIQEEIGIVTINHPPVNALSHTLRAGLKQVILRAQRDGSKALVILCEGRTFIAGFDINEFGKRPWHVITGVQCHLPRSGCRKSNWDCYPVQAAHSACRVSRVLKPHWI